MLRHQLRAAQGGKRSWKRHLGKRKCQKPRLGGGRGEAPERGSPRRVQLSFGPAMGSKPSSCVGTAAAEGSPWRAAPRLLLSFSWHLAGLWLPTASQGIGITLDWDISVFRVERSPQQGLFTAAAIPSCGPGVAAGNGDCARAQPEPRLPCQKQPQQHSLGRTTTESGNLFQQETFSSRKRSRLTPGRQRSRGISARSCCSQN